MAAAIATFDTIFCAAIEIASAEDRAAYIARACGGDAALQDRVTRLVAAHFHAGNFLEAPVGSPAATVEEPVREQPGTMIGPYKLMEQVGEGGMGLVFVAEQQQPVRRKVALKVIKPGLDTRQVIARFEAERQALALMDHPNIARVLDGGETASGRPYFVMELVNGVPITEYCDQNQIPVRERLELFRDVCAAVQHAHQKGIIHRDIKPSNILVVSNDGTPLVKVIDFGVAKAISQPLTDKTLYTQLTQLIGTPLYMSPEQAGQSGVDVDTRTDVYALGVLLYELLTGTTPFDKERLREAGYEELRRIIREEEPPRPSTRISTMGLAATTVTAVRQSDPKQLSRLLRGELDWIVMKCLEKDRNHRYESASSLARDIQRHLADEPVQACPPSAWYRFYKFGRRHKAAMAIATFLVAGLLAFGAGTVVTWHAWVEADRAAKAEKEAKETAQHRLGQIKEANKILVAIFRKIDPRSDGMGGPPLRVQLGERLKEAARSLEAAAIDDPATVANLQYELAQALEELGQTDSALAIMERACRTYEAELGMDYQETLNSKTVLADLYTALNQYERAEPLYQEVLRVCNQDPSGDFLATTCKFGLAKVYMGQRRYDRAELLLQEVVRQRAAMKGVDNWTTLAPKHSLGQLCLARGRYHEAELLFQEGLRGALAQWGPNNLQTLSAKSDLAGLYRNQGRYDLAQRLLQEVLQAQRTLLAADHPRILMSENELAVVYQGQAKYDQAELLLQKVVRGLTAQLGANHADTVHCKANLAALYMAQRKFTQAEPLYQEVLQSQRTQLAANHPDHLTTKHNLAVLYMEESKFNQAERLFKEVLQSQRTQLAADHPNHLATKKNLGSLYLRQAKYTQAEGLFQEVLQALTTKLGPEHPSTINARHALARLYYAQAQYARAETLFRQVVANARKKLRIEHPDTQYYIHNLALCYQRMKRPQSAERLLRELLDLAGRTTGTDSPDYASQLAALGVPLLQQNRPAEAEKLLRQSLAVREKKEPNAWTTFHTRSILGGVLLTLKNYVAAEPLLVQGYEGMKQRQAKIVRADRVELRDALERLVQLYDAWGKKDKADEWRKKLSAEQSGK